MPMLTKSDVRLIDELIDELNKNSDHESKLILKNAQAFKNNGSANQSIKGCD